MTATNNGNGDGDSVVVVRDDAGAPAVETIPLRPGLEDSQSSALAEQLISRPQQARPLKVKPLDYAEPETGLRLLPPTGMLESEPRWKRWMYVVIAAIILFWPPALTWKNAAWESWDDPVEREWRNGPVGYFWWLLDYNAPAHAGINQNGYLVTGKMLAQDGTAGIKPIEPAYAYLGWMWNLHKKPAADGRGEEIWYFPKYPIGTGALYAGMLKLSEWTTKDGTWEQGKRWAFYVSPAGVTLAVLAVFLIVRHFAGSFAGILAMLVFGSCQVMLAFAEQPLSHGPSLACVCWGMFFLLRFWQTGSIWRGVLAGLCLGYAMTIRYTDGLMLIPLAAAMITMVRFDTRRARWSAVAIWLVLGLAGLVAHYIYGTNLDNWKVYSALGATALVLAVIPLFFDPVTVASWRQDGETEAASYDGVRRDWRDWTAYGFHVLRCAIAAFLVWALIHKEFEKHSASDEVATTVANVILKLIIAAVIVLLYVTPWDRPRRYWRTFVPVLGWSVPVAILLSFNYFAMGDISGYDSTNESTAFTWRTFQDKWDDTVIQIYDYSMFLIPPLALAGLFLMYRWNWRAAMLVSLWMIPGTLLYIAYYYGKQRPGNWYLRFFLTCFPPMVIAAFWLLRSAADGVRARDVFGRVRGSVAVPIGMGVVAFSSAAVGFQISLPTLEREQAANLNLAFTAQQIVSRIPIVEINGKKAPPVVFAEGNNNPNGPLCNFLQFAGDYELYASDGFQRGAGRGFGRTSDSMPNPLQHERVEWVENQLRNKSEKDIIKDQNNIMIRALGEGRQVWAVLQPGTATFFKNRFMGTEFRMELKGQWKEPIKVPIERSTGALDPSARGMPNFPTRGPQTWQLYRIERAPKVVTPTTKPAAANSKTTTPPATQPATNPSASKLSAPPSTKPATTPPVTQPAKSLASPTTLPATQPATQPAKPMTSNPAPEAAVNPTTQPSTQPAAKPMSSNPATQIPATPTTQPTSQPTNPPATQPAAMPMAANPAPVAPTTPANPATQPATQPTTKPG